MKLVYVLHKSSTHTKGTYSWVESIHLTKDEAILHNENNYKGFYEIDSVYLPEKKLNGIQKFVKKLFII